MVVWAVTIPLFWYTTLHNITAGHLPIPSSLRRAATTAVAYHDVVLTTLVPDDHHRYCLPLLGLLVVVAELNAEERAFGG